MLILLVASLKGQSLLSGVVKDTEDLPLPFATVTILDSETNKLLTYATTNDAGEFFTKVDSVNRLNIITRYLGKMTDSMSIAWPSVEAFVKIKLAASSASLPKIEVTTRRRPITVQNDTTRYGVSSFRDSLDRSVEDVLRKIPGITVKEDGGIEVNGKPIQTILVEDTDMFGMDYQLGSKNIRAHDISIVETIDHYQEDAVLRDVNFSDAVVLNLKLREDKRAVVAGEFVGSMGGSRNEAKYQLYVPLYRIARKRKTFALMNMDNLASNIGLSSSNGVLLEGQNGIRTPMFEETSFHQQPTIENAALPPIFTDNTRLSTGQVREHYAFGRSKLFIKIGGVKARYGQQSTFNRYFLGKDVEYAISSSGGWEGRELEIDGEVEHTFTSKDRTFSLRTYHERTYNRPSFRRGVEGASAAEDTLNKQVVNQLYRSIATRKLSNDAVVQLTLSYQQLGVNEQSIFRQNALPTIFGEAPGTTVDQRIKFKRNRLEAEAVLLKKVGGFNFRGGVFLSQDESRFDNNMVANETPGSFYLRDYGPMFHAILNQGKWRHRLEMKYGVNQKKLNRYRITASSKKNITPVDLLTVEFQHDVNLSDLPLLIPDAKYLRGPFDYQLEPQATVLGQTNSLSIFRSFRNDQRFTSGYVSLLAKQFTDAVAADVSFQENVALNSIRAGTDGGSVNLAAGYSLFSLALKSDVKIGASARYDNRQFYNNRQLTNFQTLSYNCSGSSSWLVTHRLRLRMDISGMYTESIGGVAFNNLSGQAAGQVILTLEGLRIYVGAYAAGNTGSESVNHLVNGFIGGQKQLKVNEREVTIYARLYNPLNQQWLTSQTSSGLYLNENSIKTDGVFAYFSVSMGL